MYDQITVMAKELYEKSVALRRDLHRHPETGWLEMRTSAVIAGILTNLGYEVLTGRQVVDDRARMGLPSEEARREHTKLVRESWDTPLTYLTEEMEAGSCAAGRAPYAPSVLISTPSASWRMKTPATDRRGRALHRSAPASCTPAATTAIPPSASAWRKCS